MIKVFNAKELIKYFIKIIVPIIIIWVVISKLTNVNADESRKENNDVFFSCLDDTFEKIATKNLPGKAEQADTLDLTKIISDEVKVFNYVDVSDKDNEEKQNINNSNDKNSSKSDKNKGNTNEKNSQDGKNNNDTEKNLQNNKEDNENEKNSKNNENTKNLAKDNVKTEVVKNNVNPRYTNEYEGVKINNQTDYTLTNDILSTSSVNVNKKKVVIYHTHTSESYTSSDKYSYEQTGNFRTQDLNYTVAKVGDELEHRLRDYGIEVVHDKTCHDYPSYNGSYSRSLKTAEIIKSENPDADIFIDLHRDAIADSSYAPKVKIGDEYASQLMFVVGSDVSNKINVNWKQNFEFAIKVQKKANELYNGLFKPIILRKSEYNGHISKACVIIEVGSTGNTLDESINSMKYLAKVINEF